MNPEIEIKAKRIIEEKLGVNAGAYQNSARFVEDLKADSIDMVEMVMALEDEFDINIPDEQVDQCKTVQQLIDYVTNRVGP